MEAFAALQMERETKIENMALWYKDLTAEAKAIREEEKASPSAAKLPRLRQNGLKVIWTPHLLVRSYKSSKVAVSYRRSKGGGYSRRVREHGH